MDRTWHDHRIVDVLGERREEFPVVSSRFSAATTWAKVIEENQLLSFNRCCGSPTVNLIHDEVGGMNGKVSTFSIS